MADGKDVVLIDLVAEPFGPTLPPEEADVEGFSVRVASRHEILADKLCTLLERSELRDLDDVRVLLESGGDLERALSDAPAKDAGFSPLTLAWVLEGLPLAHLAATAGLGEPDTVRLTAYRDRLIAQILQAVRPEE